PATTALRYSSNERCRSLALALSSSAVSGATSIVIISWLILSPRFQAESYSQSYPGQDLTATGHAKPHTLPGSQGWFRAFHAPARLQPNMSGADSTQTNSLRYISKTEGWSLPCPFRSQSKCRRVFDFTDNAIQSSWVYF